MKGRKILVVVDLQKDFIDGTLAVPGAADVIPEILKVMPGFDLVYFTLDWHPVDHCSFREQGGPWPAHCVHHSAGAALPDGIFGGIEEKRMRFILKGCNPACEEYGAFSDVAPSDQDLFLPGDEVTVCGIAAEYCVKETLMNIVRLSSVTGFMVNVFLKGTARFDSYDSLLAFMEENGLSVMEA